MSSKNKSLKEGEDAWVLDSLIGFLVGPVWNVPVLTFIEHKSLIFEPDMDENEDEYKKTHEEYKNLVDFMLNSYMEDMEISSEQFESACKDAPAKVKSDFHTSLFEQVWAADDYEIFKRMMIQKNIELQLQALELLQRKYGVLPESLRPDGGKKKDSKKKKTAQAASEDEIMNAITERSSVKGDGESDEDKLGEEIAKTVASDRQRLEAARNAQQKLLEEHFKTKVSIADPSFVYDSEGQPEKTEPVVESGGEISQEEIERRKNFLKAQRDKLLAMKKEEREKQLVEAERQQMKSRPKSARAARSAFGGRGGGGVGGAGGLDPQTLKIRRALAEKLKQEVIGNP